jgi:hypothetical protein
VPVAAGASRVSKCHPVLEQHNGHQTKKTSPTWSDVKVKLADFDRAGLLGVVQDLYASSKDNQAFLHARFGLGVNLLRPSKVIIDRWLWPDIIKNQSTSVSTARKAIADYKKATGQPEGLAELTVFFCERAAGFSNEVDLQDDGYAGALAGCLGTRSKSRSP